MCDDEVSGDATAGALRNGVVLRNIFKYLSTSSLLTCSRVNQLWRQEARSFIRDFRECTIKLGYDYTENLWESLFKLNQVLGGMSVIPFNSLEIIATKENVVCKQEANANALTNLTTKFPLKFLSVCEDLGFKSCSSPAALTVLELVRRNSSLLVELEITSGVRCNALFKDWQPTEKLEKLEKLSIDKNSSVTSECAKKIILGAPNLRSIYNNCLHMIRDHVIPQNMYYTLKRLAIILEDMDLVEKFAEKLVHLEELIVDQNGNWLRENLSEDEDANKRRFFQLCQKVLALNAMTLYNLNIRFEDNFLLSQLELPVLPSVRNLYLTVYNVSEDLDQILWINFPRSFPNLRKVHFSQANPLYEDINNGDTIPDEDIMVVASQTTLELVIQHTILAEDSVTLQRLFPNVITLSITFYGDYERSGHITNLWPHLQSLHFRSTVSFPLKRIGPEVFGLHLEELEHLRSQDKEFLKRVQVPPSRPCVGTLKGLKHFKLEYVRREDPGWVETFRELVETLLSGRRPGLNFKMEPETFCHTPRFGDITNDDSYDAVEDEDSDSDHFAHSVESSHPLSDDHDSSD